MARIDRDKYGVPHIYGESVPDVFYGYGYTVAGDRLFQMEMRRRQARGQLAEVIGKTYPQSANDLVTPVQDPQKVHAILELDKRARRDYDPASLEAQFNSLAKEEKELIDGYVAGVNAKIAEVHAGKAPLPQEFVEIWGGDLWKTHLQPWTRDDLLAATTNALCSFCAFTNTLDNAQMFEFLQTKYKSDPDPQKAKKIFDTLVWLNDPYAPTSKGNHFRLAPALKIPLSGAHLAVAPVAEDLLEETVEPEGALTSMALLVSGRTAGGLFAAGPSIQLNGPQPGWNLPGYFYTVGLHVDTPTEKFHVVGHAPGGMLAITTGDNGTIAWGSTSAGGDHTIVYKEKISPDRKTYEYMGQQRPIITAPKPEIINVKNGSPVQILVHRTHRGVFLTDPTDPKTTTVYSNQVLWKGHELTSVMAWVRATQAKDWSTFQMEGTKMAMGYNWFYSDIEGHIGWLFGSYFPAISSQVQPDARLPAIGANGDAKPISMADRIFSFDPGKGYIVNWNNKPRLEYANRDLYTPRWSSGDRANILMDLMRNATQPNKPGLAPHVLTVDEVLEIYQQATTTDVNFYHFRELLKNIDPSPTTDADTKAALQLLQRWDGRRVPDKNNHDYYAGPEVAIFQQWLDELVKPLMTSVFGQDGIKALRAAANYTGTLQFKFMKNSVNLAMGTKAALHALQAHYGMRPIWMPPFDLLGGKNPSDVMLAALTTAVNVLKNGKDAKLNPTKKVADFRLAMVKQFFFPENFEGVPTASYHTKPFFPTAANRGAMQRLAIGDPGKNAFVVQDANPPGNWADPKSPHFQDQLDTYGKFGFKPLPLNVPKDFVANSHTIPTYTPPKSKL